MYPNYISKKYLGLKVDKNLAQSENIVYLFSLFLNFNCTFFRVFTKHVLKPRIIYLSKIVICLKNKNLRLWDQSQAMQAIFQTQIAEKINKAASVRVKVICSDHR